MACRKSSEGRGNRLTGDAISTPSEAIETYIRAKDGNRPWLMRGAFTQTATLTMDVRTDSLAFPGAASGLDELTEILIRRFSRDFENIYTFCLGPPPGPDVRQFSCDWLVALCSKESGEVRIGCGRYDWVFSAAEPGLVETLTITIVYMHALPPAHRDAIAAWVSDLPYPWCPAQTALAPMPALPGLGDIAAYMEGRATG